MPLAKRLILRRPRSLLSPAGRKLRLTDAHNGLRVLTRPVVEDLQITMNGMAHASEIVVLPRPLVVAGAGGAGVDPLHGLLAAARDSRC